MSEVMGTLSGDEVRRQTRRARVSGFIGSSMESYDFGLYGAAASLVFPKVFFAGVNEQLAITLSFVILLSGYIARPIGGLVFGHIGDRFGRRNVLVVTLLLMGVASVGIGLLPGSASIGAAAPILLVLLRVVQGIAYGGEYGGAVLMSLESSASDRRGFSASLAMAGGPFGAILGSLAFGLASKLAPEQLFSWGWRVPFLLSAVIVVLGLFVRRRLEESPEFVKMIEEGEKNNVALPAALVFTKYPVPVVLGVLAGTCSLFVQGLLGSYMALYLVKNAHMERSTALLLLSLSYVFHTVAIPFFAWLSDLFGRRRVMIIGMLASLVLVWPMFALFRQGSTWSVAAAFILGNAVIQASMFGPLGAFLSEMFEVKARYTGLSLSFVLATVAGAGVAPLIAQKLVKGPDTTGLTIYIEILIVLGLIAVLAAKRFLVHQHNIAEGVAVDPEQV